MSSFKEECSGYITKETENILWFAGQNLGFAIASFTNTNPNYSLNKLLNFVNLFLDNQFEDIAGWLPDMVEAMYDDENKSSDEELDPI